MLKIKGVKLGLRKSIAIAFALILLRAGFYSFTPEDWADTHPPPPSLPSAPATP